MIGRVADRAVQAFGGAGYNYTAAAGGAMIALGFGRAWQSARHLIAALGRSPATEPPAR